MPMGIGKSTRVIPKTRWVGIIIAILVIAGVGAYYTTQSPTTPPPQVTSPPPVMTTTVPAMTSEALEKVRLQIDFFPAGLHAPFYVGVDRGVFAKYGLDVTVLPSPQGSAGAIRALAAGKVDIAEADVGTLTVLSSKENINDIRAVAIYYRYNPGGVEFIKGKGIDTPKDLEGKTVGSFTGNAVEFIWPLFAKSTGIDTSKVKFEHIAATALQNSLLAGKLDAVLLFTRAVVDLRAAAKPGQEIGYFGYNDYGVNTYANMILARTDTIKNNPSMIHKFLQGYFDSLRWAIANPDEAGAIAYKLNPSLNRDVSIGEWKWTVPIMGGSEVLKAKDPFTIGYIDPARMASSLSQLGKAYGIPAPTPDSIYTNEFVKPPS